MAELVPAPFADLVTRLHIEPRTQQSLFGFPRNKWYVPPPDERDLSVQFHGQRAGNPSGPAAGPQTQMAQNLVLSYLAGGRILELKTVQVNDRLTIARPCIDMTNVGYNIEWSQELLAEQSLREYVAGSMLIEILRRDSQFFGDTMLGPPGDVIFDMSVGYDLAGIRSDKVQRFLDGMRDASALVDDLRKQIPVEFRTARELQFPTHLSGSVTLSTFHGCPADEIERICEFLLVERDVNVIVKMNPPMLGKEKLEHLLHDVLGYTELTVNPSAYTSGLQFGEAVELVDRLTNLAKSRSRGFGCKFSNTLEVVNHRTFFTPENSVQYLSGQPLHVITMTLADEFRRAVGPLVPFSFSAGVDRQNFAPAVACGFVPVTVCTDLLRPGGYGRLPGYLKMLGDEMKRVGAHRVDEYVHRAFCHGDTAKPQALSGATTRNTSIVAEMARNDPRYRAEQNRSLPKRIDSHLHTFDCITCEKCIPVCPNAANFIYPTPKAAFDCQDLLVQPNGAVRLVPGKRFEITRETQIANYADFCNECGNCDTFCPEYGGPYIQKPGFYGSIESWQRAAPRDGFVVQHNDSVQQIRGRIRGCEYELVRDCRNNTDYFTDGTVGIMLSASGEIRQPIILHKSRTSDHRVDMSIYHTLRYLLDGVLDERFVNQVNAKPSS